MIYFDAGATTLQKPETVARAMYRAVGRLSSPGRGSYPATRAAEETDLQCRTLAARLFGVADPARVVFTSCATHGLNIAVHTLVKPGGRVIISGYEHNAVTRPLHAIPGVELTVADGPLFDGEEMVRQFAAALACPADAVICTHVSNVFGFRLPVERIAALCREKGVPFVLDASQSAGMLPVDMDALGAAFIAMPGHKGLYGPQGTGLLLCRGEAAPLLFGGTAVDRMSACIINGILCLLTENTVSFVFARLHGICPGEVWHYRTCLAALVISILLVGILAARFLRRWNHCSALDPLQALLMSFFPGVVVLLNIFIMISSNRRVPTLLDLMLTVGLTIAVLVHLAIVQMFNDQVVQGQASHFQAALEQQRAEALMESYTAQRRLTHEFTNHIAALDALLRQGDLTGAQEYLSSVSKVVAAGTTILDTHNPLLDSLLSRKYEEAAQQGVELYFDLCDLKDLPFCGTDLVIVISNLLDNAIRAAAQAKPPEVYLRARRNEEEYLISVRNRVQKDLELVDGELPRSTKAEPGHGMGLVNVREVLDRCRCEYTLSCRDRWFRFTCAVPTCKL